MIYLHKLILNLNLIVNYSFSNTNLVIQTHVFTFCNRAPPVAVCSKRFYVLISRIVLFLLRSGDISLTNVSLT